MAKRAGSRRETFISASRGKSPQEKAMYHNVAGAGKSQVIREFFGLSAEDARYVETYLDERIGRRLKA